MLEETTEENGISTDIAVIGMAGRFPGARNITHFWKNLCDGVEAVHYLTDEELLKAGVKKETFQSPFYIRNVFTLDDIQYFDANFFGFTRKEAKFMDPQHRFFIECAWEALEDAGYNPEEYPGLIGIFGGTGSSSYFYNNIYPNYLPKPSLNEIYEIGLGTTVDHLTTRVAYKFNLKGPAVTVQNACATSLIALSLACQTLLEFQCDMALAGGVKIDVPQNVGYAVTPELKGVFSTDGRVRPFSKDADGMAPGCGTAIVVLKRLEDALQDHDHIYAVIKSSVLNNDGSRKMGFTAPSIQGQRAVIEAAHTMAEIDPETITFIETHGTGTDAGDVIELGALNQAFAKYKMKKKSCGIGAVKSNVGHLDTAAGVTSIIKTSLALENKIIPPTINYKGSNPEIDFENGPFYVIDKLTEWKSNGVPRRASVSAFGIGGTNAHILLEEAPPLELSGPSRPWQLVTMSAKTRTALDNIDKNLSSHIEHNATLNLADAAYTLNSGRKNFNYRSIALCRDKQEMVQILNNGNSQQYFESATVNKEIKIAFLFPGTDSEKTMMGRELYNYEEVFKQEVDHCARILEKELNIDILCFFVNDEDKIKQIYKEYPFIPLCLLFICEYALARLWMSWSIQPDAMIGHSLGEYVAACISGVLSLKNALQLVIFRGRLFVEMPEGGMIGVIVDEDRLQNYLSDSVSISAMNAPRRFVLSGPRQAIDEVEASFKADKIPALRMMVSRAGHCSLINPYMDQLTEFAKGMDLKSPQIPYISTVTGTWITEDDALDCSYWARHLRQPVNFSKGIQELLKDPGYVFLEVGPGINLSSFMRKQGAPAKGRINISSTRKSDVPYAEIYSMVEALGKLWLAGKKIEWDKFYQGEKRFRISLPAYPFDKQYYWINPPSTKTMISRIYRKTKTTAVNYDNKGIYSRVFTCTPLQKGKPGCNKKEITCLVLNDGNRPSNELITLLQSYNIITVSVTPGTGFAHKDGNTCTINPAHKGDYHKLLDTLTNIPQLIIDIRTGIEKNNAFLYSAFYFSQLIQDTPRKTVSYFIISNQTTNGPWNEGNAEKKSQLPAITGLLNQLSETIRFIHIDIYNGKNSSYPATNIVKTIFHKMDHNDKDTSVTLQENYLWTTAYSPVPETHYDSVQSDTRSNGCYVFFRGLKESSLKIADFFSRTIEGSKLVFIDTMRPDYLDEWKNNCKNCNIRLLHAEEDGGEKQSREKKIPLIKEEIGTINNSISTMLQNDWPEERIQNCRDFENASNELAVCLIADYLKGKGVNPGTGDEYRLDHIMNQSGILPKHQKYFEFLLYVLETEGVVSAHDDRITFHKALTDISPAQTVKEMVDKQYPEQQKLTWLASHFASFLDSVLTGKMEGIHIMYPDGKLDENIYNAFLESSSAGNLVRYRETATDIITKIVKNNPGRVIRILEAGAGEGLVTWDILDALRPYDNVEYYFTDIGKSFILNAQKKAEELQLDCVQFKVLDISKDPEKQDLKKYRFDVVLAFNVIHATPNIRESIKNIRKLLVPSGIMFLLESAKTLHLASLASGLIEGWWYSVDAELRLPHSALLRHKQWEDALSTEGFESVAVFPREDTYRSLEDRALIIAQNQQTIDTEDYRLQMEEKNNCITSQVKEKIEKLAKIQNAGGEITIIESHINSSTPMDNIKEIIEHTCGPVRGIIYQTDFIKNPAYTLYSKEINYTKLTKLIEQETEFLHTLQTRFKDDTIDTKWLCADPGDAFVHTLLPENKHTEGWQHITWESAVTDSGLTMLLHACGYTHLKINIPDEDLQEKEDEKTDTVQEERDEETRTHLQTKYAPPVSPGERTMVQIWEEILGESKIGIHDNFFDLGGESILAIRLSTRVKEIFGVEINLESLFSAPTIAQAVQLVEELQNNQKSVKKTGEEGKRSDENEEHLPGLEALSREKYRIQVEENNE